MHIAQFGWLALVRIAHKNSKIIFISHLNDSHRVLVVEKQSWIDIINRRDNQKTFEIVKRSLTWVLSVCLCMCVCTEPLLVIWTSCGNFSMSFSILWRLTIINTIEDKEWVHYITRNQAQYSIDIGQKPGFQSSWLRYTTPYEIILPSTNKSWDSYNVFTSFCE